MTTLHGSGNSRLFDKSKTITKSISYFSEGTGSGVGTARKIVTVTFWSLFPTGFAQEFHRRTLNFIKVLVFVKKMW